MAGGNPLTSHGPNEYLKYVYSLDNYIVTIYIYITISGWWLTVSTNPSEKYEFVSWYDEIPNIW